MSVLKTLKLSQAVPAALATNAKDRARAKIIAHLEQQHLLFVATVQGKVFEVTRSAYRTNEAGERVRVMQPVHVRRGWFEDGTGVVHFMIRYGSKALKLDKAGNSSVEVGKLDALPGVIDMLLSAVRAGELDVQLNAAAQERSKLFKRGTAANTKAA